MPKKIFVGGLSLTSSTESLERAFSPFGALVSTEILPEDEATSSSSEVAGYASGRTAVLTFADPDAGARAMLEMNGAVLDGFTIRVFADETEESKTARDKG